MAVSTPVATPPVGLRAERQGARGLWRQVWAARWCYIFSLPALVLSAMFTFYPIVASWYFSLLDWSGFTNARDFVGLANYVELVNDPFFWGAFFRSFEYMLISVPIKVSLGLFLAILLNNQALKLAAVFRTMFFMPVVTTTAIVGIVMTFIYSPFNGPINVALRSWGWIAQPIDFLGDPKLALFSIVAVDIWKYVGIPMVLWLAALQIIPQELYEAARVDGANRWEVFQYITLPLIVPFAVVIILVVSVSTLHAFSLVQTMTAGGPYFASELMEVYIYRLAFGGQMGAFLPRLGYASAAGVFFGVAVMLIAALQAGALRRLRALRSELGARDTGA